MTTAPKNNSALKIILIVVAVIVGIGIIGIAAVSFIAYRIAHRIASESRVHNRDGNVQVETPFGTVQSTTDPEEASRDLGIESYPGATVVKGTTSKMNMGNMHTAAADFETSDSPSTVADFYKSKVPGSECNLIRKRSLRHHFNRQEEHADHQHRAKGWQDQNSYRQSFWKNGQRRRFRQLTPANVF